MTDRLVTLRGRSGEVADLVGPALRRALVDIADRSLQELFGDPGPGVALLAVGGYGRRELAFGSDLDLVIVYDPKRPGGQAKVADLAESVWYPVWDAGIELDHSVRTADEAVAVADEDMKAALGLITARTIAGDADLSALLLGRLRTRWRAATTTRLPALAAMVAERAERFGEVAFLLEPDIKEARGGLRDVHALQALAAAQVSERPAGRTLDAYDLLLDVRGELHRRSTGRTRGEDRLVLQEQDAVAAALGLADGEHLARAVADAGRTIAWNWDTTWHQVAATLRPPARWRRRRPERRPLGEDVVEQDGEVQLARAASPSTEPALALRAAAAAARAGLPLGPYALERLGRETPPMPSPWPPGARDALVDLLAAGPPAVAVMESLDQVGLMVRLLPEWEQVRSKPQRNPFHRFTVDRHLIEAAAVAAGLTRRVDRPDLLLLGAFFHDIGKGWPGDHSIVGAALMAGIGPRIGLAPADADVLELLVRHHLLLPEIATRRDVTDPATAERVATTVGSVPVLMLLSALAEADGRSTGPTAWNGWKARLIGELVGRTAAVLGGTPPPPPPALDEAARALLARTDGLTVTTRPVRDEVSEIVVTAPDRPGLLPAVTGVVALHRLDVRTAGIHVGDGRAALVLQVTARRGDPPEGTLLRTDLLAALDGRLDLPARLAQREQAYAGRPRKGPPPQPPAVRFDRGRATVVEVRAPDGIGVLHRISAALEDAGIPVLTAIVATLGADVIDVFYVGGDGLAAEDARGALAQRLMATLAGPAA